MPRPDVVLIAGAGRSGSTVLAQWLESAVDAVHVGELRYLWTRGAEEHQLCECGVAFPRCSFWASVVDGACPDGLPDAARRAVRLGARVDRLRWLPANLADARRGRARPDVTAYGEVVTPLYEQALATSGAAWVIDSSKDPSYLAALLATRRLRIEVVHLVRDSRAVAYSWTRRRARPEVHWEEQLMRRLPPRRSARQWLVVNAATEACARAGVRVTRLRYEDFVADPETTRDRLVEHLGLPRRPAPASAVPTEPERHSFSGNPVRFDVGPVTIRSDDAWRTRFPTADRRLVTAMTAPLLRRYGYDLW